ncbi:hypothetical protein [Homoserinibacter sp. YIM 151385]|uniref:hypothetical protein n=1 Tax=Homoserinibacter sp. YIM 151385 TaxID=2985506 RepID=UPI0022F0C365|nr:hypothetical protein [Homoserinibacter sp. YIM 151385]WBU37609.1 hypothetical protein OF852_11915 [Homoserinibacter sp. YIM 151385]
MTGRGQDPSLDDGSVPADADLQPPEGGEDADDDDEEDAASPARGVETPERD